MMETTPDRAGSGTPKYRVLVVELDQRNFTLIAHYLGDSGVEIDSAKPTHDVLGLCAGGVADLIVVDADDDANGLEICRNLKSDPKTVGLPVIALGDTLSHKMSSFKAGVDEFMTREVGHEEFLVRVKSLLRVGASRRAYAAAQLQAEVGRQEQLRETFRRYVSPRVADQIMRHAETSPAAFVDQSVRIRASILFVDMRGFSSLSEVLSPGEVVPLLNEYFLMLTEIAFEQEGTVFSMAGDSLMVGFGVPLAQPDASVRAIRTATEMMSGFQGLAWHWRSLHGIETGIGIGINEGDVIAGNVGSRAYMSYTIIGDAVNIAARLCQRARAGEVLFSEAVKDSLDREQFKCGARKLPAMVLRGRSAPVEIFCIPTEERQDIPDI